MLTSKESVVLNHISVAAGVPFSFVEKDKVMSSCNERGLESKSVNDVINSLVKKGYVVKNIGDRGLVLAITDKVFKERLNKN